MADVMVGGMVENSAEKMVALMAVRKVLQKADMRAGKLVAL